MSEQNGRGVYAFEPLPDWGSVPDGYELGEVAAVAVDHDDNVYAFNRGPHPMVVFDREGRFIGSWGEGVFKRPHGLQLSSSGGLFCTDEDAHVVRHCTLQGEVTMTLGQPSVASEFHSGEPFNRCTHTAESPDGCIYVSDGYGNARVHKYTSSGEYMFSWGRAGTGPGEFNLPHNIVCDQDGLVYVADRENHRIQVFDGDGAFQGEWRDLHRPSAVFLERTVPPVIYVAEIGPYLRSNHGWPNLGPRISVMEAPRGDLLARAAQDPSTARGPDALISPHGIAMDSHGDLYIADVAHTGWPSLFPDAPMPASLRTLHKWRRTNERTVSSPSSGGAQSC
jgi:DNA-binding beta-propeller fold protein YncE